MGPLIGVILAPYAVGPGEPGGDGVDADAVGREHPIIGGSWEGYVIENIISALPRRASYDYDRTSGGAELDLVINVGAGEIWVVEVKCSSAPGVSKGFHSACENLRPARKFVVHADHHLASPRPRASSTYEYRRPKMSSSFTPTGVVSRFKSNTPSTAFK